MRRALLILSALLGPAAFAAPSVAAGRAPPAPPQQRRTAPPPGDTVVQARRGDRLVIENLSGHVIVRPGAGDVVRITPSTPDEESVGLVRSGDRLTLTGREPGGRARERRLEIEVPSWMALNFQGNRLAVDVEGLRADVSVRNVEGDLVMRDLEGTVDLWTVEGAIRLSDVRGRISAHSVDEDVEMVRVEGEVEVGSTDGDLRLTDMDATRVEAESVDGDIAFNGRLRPGGSYALATHGGDLDVAVPQDADVQVSVSTFDGSFEAAFPVTVERFRGGREMSFRLGEGSARLVLQAFDGDIALRHRRAP